MADHVIKQLRDALVTRLTGLATTGARVHSYRANPLQTIGELPALIVRTPSDSMQEATVHPGAVVERTVEILVQGYAAANADLDDTLDAIRKDVDTALGAALTIGSNTVPVDMTGDSDSDITDGEVQAGEINLRYRATLYHVKGVPDVLL